MLSLIVIRRYKCKIKEARILQQDQGLDCKRDLTAKGFFFLFRIVLIIWVFLIRFFADYEIPNLQKDKISKIVIWVVDDIQGPDR